MTSRMGVPRAKRLRAEEAPGVTRPASQRQIKPRGPRKRSAKQEDLELGDCIDCTLCVQVCPTGIDIRDGLQYQCIGCAHCIDACNQVMDKMGYERNLISFTTEQNLEGAKTHIFRPRFVGYTLVLIAMSTLFLYTVATRIPMEVDVIRDRNLLFRETPDGLIENIYTLKIANMENEAHRFRVDARGDYDFQFKGDREVLVDGGEVYTALVRLVLDPGLLRETNSKVFFQVEAVDDEKLSESEESRFIGPSFRR